MLLSLAHMAKVLPSLAYMVKSAPEFNPCGDKCSRVYTYTWVTPLLKYILFYLEKFVYVKALSEFTMT